MGRLIWMIFVMGCTGAALGADVWWEGESPARTNFPGSWLSGDRLAKRDVLSAGDWLTIDGPAPPGGAVATYRVQVADQGTYHFWVRKFWKHGPFNWHFDEQPLRECGPEAGLEDSAQIQQFVEANWVSLGDVTLEKGPHFFEIKLLAKPGEHVTAGLDCFLLTQGVFQPRGKLKPGEKFGKADEGWFPFEPGLDAFQKDSPIDWRGLNEKVAGEKGYVKREGDHFLLASGEPVRFWAAGIGNENAAQSRASMDYLARRLAKLGVNMVRFHSPLFDEKTPATIDPKKLDNLHYLVAAMKREGIYVTLSFYFPLWLDAEKQLGFKDYAGRDQKHPFALAEFDPEMQALYRSWARNILTVKNPYTEMPLATDPAVAIVEIQNEDSFFFWTFNDAVLSPARMEELEKQFGAYLEQKFGSVVAAIVAFDGFGHPRDDPGNHRAGLFNAWDMTADGVKNNPAKQKRIGQQIQFLAQTQQKFFAQTTAYFKNDLHYGGLVDPGNWTTADPRMLDAVERWTYLPGDVMDRHGYFAGKHQGDNADWQVAAGQTFESKAAVSSLEELPIEVIQTAGYPQIISELGFTQPNRYRSDAALMAAAYGSLQGVDGIYFFAVGSNTLLDTAMNKFQLGSPAMAGTWPAAALIYRRGDVAEEQAAVKESVAMGDLWAMKGTKMASATALDTLRAPTSSTDTLTGPNFASHEFYMGPVVRNYAEKSDGMNLRSSGALPDQRRIVSSTKQLDWDYGNGLLKIDTSHATGAAGFLGKAGKITAGIMTAELKNEFGSVVLVSLDGKELGKSSKMLLQVMTQEQPYGFKTLGNKIAEMGGLIYEVQKVEGVVELKMPGALKIQPLDENGDPTDRRLDATDNIVKLLPDVIYYLVTLASN